MEFIFKLLNGGIGNLAAYLAAHVLLCLLPAFYIAGAMAALIPKASITRWLGRNAPPQISYPAGVAAGSLLAVCSCTIVPLFAGIYRKGAGIGPAITFLFFAPAGNIMALAYTGNILGLKFATARFILCLMFGICIGLLMAIIFWRDDIHHDSETDALFSENADISPAAMGVLLSLVALLIAGTLKLWPLTATFTTLHIPFTLADDWQRALLQWVPFDAAKGEEGLSVQGSILISLLVVIATMAWRGLENIIEGANRWTWTALGLAATTLLVAALRITPQATGIDLSLTGRFFFVALSLGAVWFYASRLGADEWRAWLWESWRFIKQIFVLLVIGVTVVGMVRQVIRPEWIETLAGSNTVPANAISVGFGVFMYFPTLVEVPVARMFLDLGMHPGPLLAYLMADPELSLQSILMVSAVIGYLKTFTYVGLVSLFSIGAGLLYGAWIDGLPWNRLVLGLIVMSAGLGIALVLLRRRHRHARTNL